MPKTESRFVTLTHPLPLGNLRELPDIFGYLESQGFMRQAGGFQGGSIEEIEFRKVLDYSREERRAAEKSGQILEFNRFKGILPEGWTPIAEDDPRLQVPPPAEGDTP